MPRVSARLQKISLLLRILERRARARIIHEITKAVVTDGLPDSTKDVIESFFNPRIDLELISKVIELDSNRYSVSRKGNYRPRTDLCVMQHFLYSGPGPSPCPQSPTDIPWLNEAEFKNEFRMDRNSFFKLLHLIRDHPIFHRDSKGPKQASPEYQLMVLLRYLGSEGEVGSNPKIRNTFRISYGSVQKFRDRALQAVLSLRSDTIFWPNTSEKSTIKERIEKEYVLPNCVGFVDGTLFPLSFKPSREDAADYHGRKFAFSINAMIVCSDGCNATRAPRITIILVG